MIFDRGGGIQAAAQREHRQIYPQPGWVEHDALEILGNTRAVIREAIARAGIGAADLAAVGITNQRETTVLWDRRSGKPLYNALVWQDTRVDTAVAAYAKEGGPDRFRARTGLPLASYFSALKLQWLLNQVPGARALAEAGDALFGTIDAWLAWNLTGGARGGLHLTDVTNASRTQLLNLATLDWERGFAARIRHTARGIAARRLVERCLRRDHRTMRSAACRSPACSGTNKRRSWVRLASTRARRRTPTGPAVSC